MSYIKREIEFVNFVKLREEVRVKKERGDARPFSDDEIMNTYHFCNVRRADDRVTKWIGQWAKGQNWFWYVVARWINQPETLTALTPALPTKTRKWNLKLALKILGKIDKAGASIFRGSYIITGAMSNRSKDGRKKYETILIEVLDKAWKAQPRISHNSIERSWLELRKLRGMGPFMAGQIVADWQTFGIINGKDVKTWAPLGPGSKRGLEYIYDKKFNQKTAVYKMYELWHNVMMIHIRPLAKTLTLHDVQNCLCEFSKYKRGWSKTKYVPHQETLL